MSDLYCVVLENPEHPSTLEDSICTLAEESSFGENYWQQFTSDVRVCEEFIKHIKKYHLGVKYTIKKVVLQDIT